MLVKLDGMHIGQLCTTETGHAPSSIYSSPLPHLLPKAGGMLLQARLPTAAGR